MNLIIIIKIFMISLEGSNILFLFYLDCVMVLFEVLLGGDFMLELVHIYLSLNQNNRPLIKDLSFEVDRGEILSIIGKSGCGKSTMLKIVAGFLSPDSGKIIVNGKEHKKPTRNVMYLQQNYEQLFAWRNVVKNISYSIEQLKLGKEEKKKRAEF